MAIGRLGLVRGGGFGGMGAAGGKSTPTTNFLLLVDGTSVLLLANGTDKLLITGVTPSITYVPTYYILGF